MVHPDNSVFVPRKYYGKGGNADQKCERTSCNYFINLISIFIIRYMTDVLSHEIADVRVLKSLFMMMQLSRTLLRMAKSCHLITDRSY